jgi:hypothetical protein
MLSSCNTNGLPEFINEDMESWVVNFLEYISEVDTRFTALETKNTELAERIIELEKITHEFYPAGNESLNPTDYVAGSTLNPEQTPNPTPTSISMPNLDDVRIVDYVKLYNGQARVGLQSWIMIAAKANMVLDNSISIQDGIADTTLRGAFRLLNLNMAEEGPPRTIEGELIEKDDYIIAIGRSGLTLLGIGVITDVYILEKGENARQKANEWNE